MKFSIIFTTIDNTRKKEILRLLDSLKKVNVKLQIIFIYQKNKFNIDKMILSKLSTFSEIIKKEICVTSLSNARNIGLNYVTGDIIVFSDDDCWYNETILSDVEKYFFTSNIDILCTNVYDPIINKYYGNRPIDIKEINLFNICKLPISVGIFVKKETIDKIRFNENIGAGTNIGSGEETFFLYELFKKNKKIIYDGNLNVYHPANYSDNYNIDKAYLYGIGFGYINALILKDKNFKHMFYFIYIVFRSMLGIFIKLLTFNKNYNIYVKRFKGIIKGFFNENISR
jgi:hypothetical protein